MMHGENLKLNLCEQVFGLTLRKNKKGTSFQIFHHEGCSVCGVPGCDKKCFCRCIRI